MAKRKGKGLWKALGIVAGLGLLVHAFAGFLNTDLLMYAGSSAGIVQGTVGVLGLIYIIKKEFL